MKSELSSKNSFASSTTKSSRRTRTEIVKTVSSTSFSSSSSSSSNSSTTSIECYDSGYETTTTTKTTAAAVKCEQVVKNKELTTLQDARLAQSHHGKNSTKLHGNNYCYTTTRNERQPATRSNDCWLFSK